MSTTTNISKLRSDFSNLMSNEIQVSVTRTPVTRTNKGFSVSRSDGTPASLNGIFYLKGRVYSNMPEGWLENCDALILVSYDATINKEDEITYGNNNYRVTAVYGVPSDNSDYSVFKRAELVKI